MTHAESDQEKQNKQKDISEREGQYDPDQQNEQNQDKQNEKNKKDPHGGVKDTQARGRDKVQLTLEWIGRFHCSVCSVIAKLLNVDKTNAHRMLKKLKDKQCLRSVEVPVVREEVYMLTPAGLTLSAEFADHPLKYHVEPYRLNINCLRHDLNVQIAVLHRLKHENRHLEIMEKTDKPEGLRKTVQKITFLSERELDLTEETSKYRQNNFGTYGDQRNKKIPDALIIEELAIEQSVGVNNDVETKKTGEIKEEKEVRKTALEIELTPKADISIYNGFIQHFYAMQYGHLYDHVTYIFRTQTMKHYYEKRFLKDIWPRYQWDEQHKRWTRSEKPLFSNHPLIRSRFSFVVEELFNG